MYCWSLNYPWNTLEFPHLRCVVTLDWAVDSSHYWPVYILYYIAKGQFVFMWWCGPCPDKSTFIYTARFPYVRVCVHVYQYHIKTGLKIWSVSIHAYAYPSSIWIATLWEFKWMMDPSPGLGYGRTPLMTWKSNKTHYAAMNKWKCVFPGWLIILFAHFPWEDSSTGGIWCLLRRLLSYSPFQDDSSFLYIHFPSEDSYHFKKYHLLDFPKICNGLSLYWLMIDWLIILLT